MPASDPIEQELRRMPPLRVDRPTAAKYHQIKQRLSHIARRHAIGSRLPPIRTLSRLFKVAPAPVHRAIVELCREGVLQSRTGSGVFIGEAAHLSGDEPITPLGQIVRRVNIQCARPLTHLAEFWDEVVAGFEAEHPRVKTAWHDPADAADPDIAEAVPHVWLSEPHEVQPWLDLRDFLRAGSTGGTERTEIDQCPYFTPFHQPLPCVLLNLEELKRRRIPTPDYSDFAGQMAYIERLMEYDTDEKPFVRSNIQPAIWLGSYGHQLRQTINMDEDDEPALSASKLDNIIHRLLPLMRTLIQFSPTDVASQFAGQDMPVLLTLSYYIGTLRRQDVPFPWMAYPLFAIDDRICAVPAAIGVNRRTAFPMECIWLIEYLHSPKVQKSLIAHDLVGLHPGADVASRLFTPGKRPPTWMTEALGRIHRLTIGSHREAYLYTNIINHELRACAKGSQTSAETVSRIIAMGRAYLRHFN